MVAGKLSFFHFFPLFTSHQIHFYLLRISFTINSQVHIHCLLWRPLPLFFWFLLIQGTAANIIFLEPFSILFLNLVVKLYRFTRDCTELLSNPHCYKGARQKWVSQCSDKLHNIPATDNYTRLDPVWPYFYWSWTNKTGDVLESPSSKSNPFWTNLISHHIETNTDLKLLHSSKHTWLPFPRVIEYQHSPKMWNEASE